MHRKPTHRKPTKTQHHGTRKPNFAVMLNHYKPALKLLCLAVRFFSSYCTPPTCICVRLGQKPYIYGVYTVFLAGKSPNIRSCTVCIYGSGQPYTCICVRLGQKPCAHVYGITFTKYTLTLTLTMGGDLQPGCLADRLLTGLGQPQINP